MSNEITLQTWLKGIGLGQVTGEILFMRFRYDFYVYFKV